MITRRCRATSVDIQSHNEKSELRPQQSYALKNQSSIGDDSNGFTHPNMVVRRFPSEERVSLPTRSGPSSAPTKSFTIDPPIHAVQEAMATPGMATNSASRSMKESENEQNPLEELLPSREEPGSTQKQGTLEPVTSNNTCTNPKPQKMFGDGANSTKVSTSDRSSIKSTSQSSISSLSLAFSQDEGSVCRPSGQRPSQRRSKNTPNTSESRPESAETSQEIEITNRGGFQLPAESSNTIKTLAGSTEPAPRLPPTPMIVIDDACMPILATETELPEDIHHEDVDSSASQKRLQGEVETYPMAERQSSVRAAERFVRPEQPMIESLALKGLPSTNEESEPPAVPSNNPPATIAANGSTMPWSNESQEDLVGKKPMSAQAKRRAAHARRMHLAFGNVANT